MIFTILWGVGIVNKASEAEINDPRTPPGPCAVPRDLCPPVYRYNSISFYAWHKNLK